MQRKKKKRSIRPQRSRSIERKKNGSCPNDSYFMNFNYLSLVGPVSRAIELNNLLLELS